MGLILALYLPLTSITTTNWGRNGPEIGRFREYFVYVGSMGTGTGRCAVGVEVGQLPWAARNRGPELDCKGLVAAGRTVEDVWREREGRRAGEVAAGLVAPPSGLEDGGCGEAGWRPMLPRCQGGGLEFGPGVGECGNGVVVETGSVGSVGCDSKQDYGIVGDAFLDGLQSLVDLACDSFPGLGLGDRGRVLWVPWEVDGMPVSVCGNSVVYSMLVDCVQNVYSVFEYTKTSMKTYGLKPETIPVILFENGKGKYAYTMLKTEYGYYKVEMLFDNWLAYARSMILTVGLERGW